MILSLAFILIAAAGLKVNAQEESAWTRLLGTPGGDSSFGIAVDAHGNSHISGYTGGNLNGYANAGVVDIFVAKYDTEGNRQWTRLLGTPGEDIGFDIAIDSNGNIYVTGRTEGNLDGIQNSGGDDAFIAKYNSNGDRLWTRLLGTSSVEVSYGVAVDSNGNSYITGFTNASLDNQTYQGLDDVFIAKFDTNGNKQWTRMIGTADQDVGYGIAVDTTGNIYITGTTNGDLEGISTGAFDIFIAKYDVNGNYQWTRQIGTTSTDIGWDVAVDDSGYCYITGYTNGDLDGKPNAGGSDIFISKYDTTGKRRWTILMGSASEEEGWRIVVDNRGFGYVTGFTEGNLEGNPNMGGTDLFVAQFSTIGYKKHTSVIGTDVDDEGDGIDVDADGNVYVAGGTKGNLGGNINSGDWDILISKIIPLIPKGISPGILPLLLH